MLYPKYPSEFEFIDLGPSWEKFVYDYMNKQTYSPPSGGAVVVGCGVVEPVDVVLSDVVVSVVLW